MNWIQQLPPPHLFTEGHGAPTSQHQEQVNVLYQALLAGDATAQLTMIDGVRRGITEAARRYVSIERDTRAAEAAQVRQRETAALSGDPKYDEPGAGT